MDRSIPGLWLENAMILVGKCLVPSLDMVSFLDTGGSLTSVCRFHPCGAK